MIDGFLCGDAARRIPIPVVEVGGEIIAFLKLTDMDGHPGPTSHVRLQVVPLLVSSTV